MSEHRCIDSSKMLEKLLFNVKHGQVEYELVLKDLKISVVTYFYKMAAKKKKKTWRSQVEAGRTLHFTEQCRC